MNGLKLENLTKRYGNLTVFENLSIELPPAKITVFLGPSGCGKTTILHIIAGITPADTGKLEGLYGRTVSCIFQEPRLLPWKTVKDNINVILPETMTRHERLDRVETFIGFVGLDAFSEYYPDQLSGGMKQRVAIARAFAYPGEILLMDEPFKGLDLQLRLSLIKSFEDLWLNDPRTTVFVTHDIQEALLLGDEIIVLSSLPSRIAARFSVGIGRPGRSLEDERMLALEQELYHYLLHTDGSS